MLQLSNSQEFLKIKITGFVVGEATLEIVISYTTGRNVNTAFQQHLSKAFKINSKIVLESVLVSFFYK